MRWAAASGDGKRVTAETGQVDALAPDPSARPVQFGMAGVHLSAASPGGMDMSLCNLTKVFGAVTAVNSISLEIQAGEFITLLGPSGSGKTTTLMMIAGFEFPTSGEIYLGEREVTRMAPHQRGIGIVFQNYALFPHMTVFENVAFPLQMRRMGSGPIRECVARALEMVQLSGFERRFPRQLSGGQQQRVALARALVFRPPILLMDEPLGALDRKLRAEMQLEIKRLHRRVGGTVVYVTHDQEEALTMSDRVAVMNHGLIEQLDTPEGIYERPVNTFVAGFIGESNLLEAQVQTPGPPSARAVTASGLELILLGPDAPAVGGRVTVALRPEKIRLVAKAREGLDWHEGLVEEVVYIGETRKYRVRVRGQLLAVNQQTGSGAPCFAEGDQVQVRWDPTDLKVVRRHDVPPSENSVTLSSERGKASIEERSGACGA